MKALNKEQSEEFLKKLIHDGIVEVVPLPWEYALTERAFESFKTLLLPNMKR